MRAFYTHFGILTALCGLGLAALVSELLTEDSPGGLFTRHALTRPLWMGIGLYAGVSTLLVILVWGTLRHLRRSYPPLGVVVTHLLPVALITLILDLGVHDWIQTAWEAGQQRKGGGDEPPRPDRPRVPLSAPLHHHFPSAQGHEGRLTVAPVVPRTSGADSP